MYNRYIPPDVMYSPLPQEEPSSPAQSAAPEGAAGRQESQPHRPPQPTPPPSRNSASNDLLGGAVQEISKVLGGLFQHFSLNNLDTGDILLILIILFLFLERDDNLDLVIALGLMLLLSLGESDDENGAVSPPSDIAPSHPEG